MPRQKGFGIGHVRELAASELKYPNQRQNEHGEHDVGDWYGRVVAATYGKGLPMARTIDGKNCCHAANPDSLKQNLQPRKHRDARPRAPKQESDDVDGEKQKQDQHRK